MVSVWNQTRTFLHLLIMDYQLVIDVLEVIIVKTLTYILSYFNLLTLLFFIKGNDNDS